MGKFFLLLVGFGLAWHGCEERQLAAVAKAEPQTITCEDLGANGPGENAHVRMTDHLLLYEEFVITSEEEDASSWDQSWVPAVPVDGAFARRMAEASEDDVLPMPKEFAVLVYEDSPGDEEQLAQRFASRQDEEPIQGLVINEVDSLDFETRRILAESYPGFDADRVWILERGRKPDYGSKPLWFMGVGIVFLLLGVLGLWSGFLERRAARARKSS